MSLIQTAAATGDLPKVQQLIESGENVNFQDEWGDTPLIQASIYGYANIVQVLIQSGSKVNLKNEEDMTALLYASEKAHSDVVYTLLESGANINDRDNRGNTVLMLGIDGVLQSGSTEVVQMLLQANPDIHLTNRAGTDAFQKALGYGLTDIARTLVERGADIKGSLIFDAINGRNPDTVRFVIQAGVQVHNVKLIEGTTPLMWGVLKGYTEIVNILIEVGVDAKAKNNRGETALTIAIAENRKDIIDLLHQADL